VWEKKGKNHARGFRTLFQRKSDLSNTGSEVKGKKLEWRLCPRKELAGNTSRLFLRLQLRGSQKNLKGGIDGKPKKGSAVYGRDIDRGEGGRKEGEPRLATTR